MTCKLSGVVSPCFAKIHREIKAGNVKELVAKGGRGSTKSSYISIELILQLLKHPQCHAAVFRKVGNTLRTSVYRRCHHYARRNPERKNCQGSTTVPRT